MIKIGRVAIFVSATILCAGAALASLNKFGLFEVGSIPIELLGDREELAHSLGPNENRLKDRLAEGLKILRGRKIWEIDLTSIKAAVAKDEWVRDILVSRSFPNGLSLRVRPKMTALVMVSKQNKFIPVTDEAEILSALPASQLPDVPLLRGDIFFSDKAKRERMVKFAMSLGDDGPLARKNVSEILWSDDEGYAVTLIQPKVEVKLGDDRMDLKAMRVAQVLNYLSVNNLRGRVIDASFSKKVLVRLRKGP